MELAHKLYKGEGCSEQGGGKLMKVGRDDGVSASWAALKNKIKFINRL